MIAQRKFESIAAADLEMAMVLPRYVRVQTKDAAVFGLYDREGWFRVPIHHFVESVRRKIVLTAAIFEG